MHYYSTMDDFFDSYEMQCNQVMEEESKMPESSDLLDRIQALHTTLCYLCRINADISHVQDFVFHHPEALLLEGTHNDPTENAAFILSEHERSCQCLPRSSCRSNRAAVQRLLHKGFTFAQSKSLDAYQEQDWWSLHQDKLMEYEKDIRLLRQQEFNIRQFALDASVQVHKYQDELLLAEQYYSLKPKFSLFSCGMPHNQVFARRSVLEYQVNSAQVELTSLERLHQSVVTKIKTARRLQYGILERSLPCTIQHFCETRAKGSAGEGVSDVSFRRNRRGSAVCTEEFSI
jgi:hypothetical protein